MKAIKNYILEKLKIRKSKYNYTPNNSAELIRIVKELINERGKYANLNDIDTSNVKKFIDIFLDRDFDGDISEWEVSQATHFTRMFLNSTFTGKKSDLSQWNVSNGIVFSGMFQNSAFNNDISNWNINSEAVTNGMFDKCPINNSFKPYLYEL